MAYAGPPPPGCAPASNCPGCGRGMMVRQMDMNCLIIVIILSFFCFLGLLGFCCMNYVYRCSMCGYTVPAPGSGV